MNRAARLPGAGERWGGVIGQRIAAQYALLVTLIVRDNKRRLCRLNRPGIIDDSGMAPPTIIICQQSANAAAHQHAACNPAPRQVIQRALFDKRFNTGNWRRLRRQRNLAHAQAFARFGKSDMGQLLVVIHKHQF
ncbi:hypothetical protein GCM10011445_36290 [Pseudocitrobacter faecalis]|nr:hypothetical protein GCM10011445_36290 [Pseudocitrobacter faecalis]